MRVACEKTELIKVILSLLHYSLPPHAESHVCGTTDSDTFLQILGVPVIWGSFLERLSVSGRVPNDGSRDDNDTTRVSDTATPPRVYDREELATYWYGSLVCGPNA